MGGVSAVAPRHAFGQRDGMQHDIVLIVDFGSQVTQLIARRVREAGVYCEIHPSSRARFSPKALIFSASDLYFICV